MIQSMTAYTRLSQQRKWGTITWEIRSVNHRYLDCGLRLPDTLRQLEPDLRELVRKQLSRGRVECFLKYQPGKDAALQLSVNKNLVKQLATAAIEVGQYFNGSLAAINPMHVLSWHDVLQIAETDSEEINKGVVTLFQKALTKLITVRNKEGAALKKLISQRLKKLKIEVTKIKKLLPTIIQQKRGKILAHLKEIQGELDPTRLEQEMVFFTQKIDIAEELDRLQAHIKEVARLLRQGGTIGKRLDFLMQELNREANTLASKSVAKKTTHAAIQLKVLIEQMREQVQNIE